MRNRLIFFIVAVLSLTISPTSLTSNAAPNPIEIISIAEVSCTSVEILFDSSIPKKALSYYVISAVVDDSVVIPKNIKKVIKTKTIGLITAEMKNLNPKAIYNFSVSVKTNKGKMTSSKVVKYSSVCYLMDLLSNLPSDWGNPKPIQLPTAAPAAAPVAAPAAKVAITQASVGTSPGIAFITQPQITIQDSGGNTITSSTAVVTATVSTGGTLVGTATATASSGVATFSNLGIRGFGATAYTITYTAAGLTTATQSVTPSALSVGNTGPGGGKIFYATPTSDGFDCGPTTTEKCYYLEAAPTTGASAWTDVNQSWSTGGNQSISVPNATGTDIGTGYKNSLSIVAQSGNVTETSAAVAARAYGGPNNLTDWFLPSKDELNALYLQKSAVGGFVEGPYWYSSEVNAESAGLLYFSFGGAPGSSPKSSSTPYIRPVRAF
jgi:hypothetical protein